MEEKTHKKSDGISLLHNNIKYYKTVEHSKVKCEPEFYIPPNDPSKIKVTTSKHF